MRVRWTLRPRGARVRRRDCRSLRIIQPLRLATQSTSLYTREAFLFSGRRGRRPLPVKSRRQPCISSAKGGIVAIRRSDTTNDARYRKRYASHRRCVYHPSKAVYHQHVVLYTYRLIGLRHKPYVFLSSFTKKTARLCGFLYFLCCFLNIYMI